MGYESQGLGGRDYTRFPRQTEQIKTRRGRLRPRSYHHYRERRCCRCCGSCSTSLESSSMLILKLPRELPGFAYSAARLSNRGGPSSHGYRDEFCWGRAKLCARRIGLIWNRDRRSLDYKIWRTQSAHAAILENYAQDT